jgi:hypothetical protein
VFRRQASSTAAAAAAAVLALALVAPAGAATGAPPTRLHVGDTFIVSGQTGSARGRVTRAVGLVVVRGSWAGSGRWYLVTTTRTDANGRYRFRLRPRMRGVLTLRVSTPDHVPHQFVLRVV